MSKSFVFLINGNEAVHVGYFANSVEIDQPASSEADWSGSTLFVMQFMPYCMIWLILEWYIFTC